MKQFLLNRIKKRITFICVLGCMLLPAAVTYGQTAEEADRQARKEAGALRYKAELDEKMVGEVTLVNNQVEISGDLLDLNSVWVVNHNYPNMPFGVVTVKNDMSLIDLSNAPDGEFYIQGMKNGVVVAYKTKK